MIHVPGRVGCGAEDHARVVVRKHGLRAVPHAGRELDGRTAHLLQPHLRHGAILACIRDVDDHARV